NESAVPCGLIKEDRYRGENQPECNDPSVRRGAHFGWHVVPALKAPRPDCCESVLFRSTFRNTLAAWSRFSHVIILGKRQHCRLFQAVKKASINSDSSLL